MRVIDAGRSYLLNNGDIETVIGLEPYGLGGVALKGYEFPNGKVPYYRPHRFELVEDEPATPSMTDLMVSPEAIDKAFTDLEMMEQEMSKGQTTLGGIKHDTDKPRMELLPPSLAFSVAKVLTFGANKYAARNWEKGIAYGRCFGALMRHLWAWWRGEDKDQETGFSHLWHAGCELAFMIEFEERLAAGTLPQSLDDRPHREMDREAA